MKYKLALQPNKHINTWKRISTTIFQKRWSLWNLFEKSDYDFLQLKNIIQKEYKKWFPYLSWQKIFNYRSFIIQKYWNIRLRNSEFIEIAPDTHIMKCSVLLWIIKESEIKNIKRDEVSKRWRKALEWTGITPIKMHAPLWFWSRNDFKYKL